MAHQVMVVSGDDLAIHYDATQIVGVIEDFKSRGGNIAELTPVIAEEMVTHVIENFDQERGFKQGAWQPLSPITIAMRRESSSYAILRDTGVLYGSIEPGWNDYASEAFTNVPYAKYHVSPEPRKKIPLRDFFDIDWQTINEYAIDLMLAEVTS